MSEEWYSMYSSGILIYMLKLWCTPMLSTLHMLWYDGEDVMMHYYAIWCTHGTLVDDDDNDACPMFREESHVQWLMRSTRMYMSSVCQW